jgi:hypothetical protein
MLYRKIMAVYCGNHTEQTNTLRGQNVEFLDDRTGAADLPLGFKVLNDDKCSYVPI